MDRKRTPIKSYYFYRNGAIHHRYVVDDCIALSKDEGNRIKRDLANITGNSPVEKQEVLRDYYALFKQMGRSIVDGCQFVANAIKGKRNG